MTSTTDTLRKSWRWRAIAVVAAAGLAVGACGGDDADDASVSETGTEDPVDTVTSTPTTAAAAAPAQDAMHVAGSSDGFSELEPGPYFIDPDGDDTTRCGSPTRSQPRAGRRGSVRSSSRIPGPRR